MRKLLLALLFLANVAANTSPGAGYGSSPTAPVKFANILGIGPTIGLLTNQFFNFATCTQAATVGSYSVCQMYNPVGSGVNDILWNARCAAPSVQGQLEVANTPRTTFLGNAPALTFGSGVTSKTQFYKDVIASPGTYLMQRTLVNGYSGLSPVTPGIALGPGKGIEAVALTLNTALSCDWQFWEMPQ